MKYQNGDKYEGQWQNGLKNGAGTYIYSDGSKYQGEWKNDQMYLIFDDVPPRAYPC